MGRVTASGGMALSAEDPLTTLTLLEAVLLMNQSKICSFYDDELDVNELCGSTHEF